MMTKIFASIVILWNLPMLLVFLVLSPWLSDDAKKLMEKLR